MLLLGFPWIVVVGVVVRVTWTVMAGALIKVLVVRIDLGFTEVDCVKQIVVAASAME